MKIFHTADWHLGKLIHGIYMTDDQRYILYQLVERMKAENPDLLIIAGDIYDRAIPPTEAIELFDDILTKIISELHIPIIAIGGNHDSPSRLNFGTHFMKKEGFYLIGEYCPEMAPIILNDSFGEVHIYPIPYADPAYIRHRLNDESIKTHDDAMRAITQHIGTKLSPSSRNIAVAHAFVTHSSQSLETSQSERPLAIGGSERVRAEHFSSFHYTALGHLHQAQKVYGERIQYSGSPLKYSLSEATHHKGFLMIEMDGKGDIVTKKHTFIPKRDLREVNVAMPELLPMTPSQDYVFITLLDETPVLHPMEQIRTVFPNAMHVQRVTKKNHSTTSSHPSAKLSSLSENDHDALFHSFYQQLMNETPSSSMKKLFNDTLMMSEKEE